MSNDLFRSTDRANVNLDGCENDSACDLFAESKAELDSPNMLTLHVSVSVVWATTSPFGTVFENGVCSVSVLSFDGVA